MNGLPDIEWFVAIPELHCPTETGTAAAFITIIVSGIGRLVIERTH